MIPGMTSSVILQRITRPVYWQRWIGVIFSLMAIALGIAHTWAAVTSHSMNADGISYLDIGDAYMRGDWKNAINPVWPPLYSWILGLFLRIFQPSMRWEFPLVHLANFLIYLLAFACFAFFWRQASIYKQARQSHGTISLPTWAFQALGYLLFIWASLTQIEIWAVTPDMLLSAIVYLAAALILRMRINAQNWGTHALLGFVLGLAYLAKTVMLPIGIIMLGLSLFSAGGLHRSLPRVMVSLVAFVLVAGPFIALISLAKGRFTYGESGTITYVRYVNGVTYPHWQGEPPGSGVPAHPSRKIFNDPPIYEFATPVGGTYPITYDPSYWYEGVQPRFTLQEQTQAMFSNALVYYEVFFRELGPVLAGLLVLYLLAPWRALPVIAIIRKWNLAILAVMALLLYALVFVEGRYMGVFVVLLFADLLANLSFPGAQPYKRLASATSALMIVFLLINLVAYNLEGFSALVSKPNQQQEPIQAASPPGWPGEVAEELFNLGVAPGDRVGVIGYAFDSFWARLARVKIVAEMFEWEADPFYLGSPEFQSEVIQAFVRAGVRAIIAEQVPAYTSLEGWHQVGKSNYYVYRISQP